jgi:diguanylate cyclase (GGDEF)-like protein/PAS domain S-box-containing protein
LLARREGKLAARRDDQSRLRQTFELQATPLAIKDAQSIYREANLAFAALLGKTVGEVLEKRDADLFPRPLAEALRQAEDKATQRGSSQSFSAELQTPSGLRWLRVIQTPHREAGGAISGLVVTGMVVTVEDVTPQKAAETALEEACQGRNRLHEAELELLAAHDLGGTQESILSGAERLAGSGHVCLWAVEPGRKRLGARAARGKLEAAIGSQARPGENLAGKVWQSGQLLQVNDYASWPGRSQTSGQSSFTAALGLPLKAGADITGVLCVYRDRPGQAFTPTQVELLERFASSAAASLGVASQYASLKGDLEEQRQVNNCLQQRLRLEHLVAAFGAHFTGLPPEDIDQDISRSLQTLARTTGVDRASIVLFPGDGNMPASLSPAYGNQAVSKGATQLPVMELHWLLSRLNQLETVHLPHRSGLPAEMEEAGAYLESHGIQSFTAVPLVANRAIIGFLSFEAQRGEVEFSPETLALLKIVGEMYVNLLERKWAARSSQETKAKVDQQIASLEQRSRENALINELGDLLQACRTADEAYPIIARYAEKLIPGPSGGLYMIRYAADPAEMVVGWGQAPPGPGERDLPSNECWGLRRGRLYAVKDVASEPVCAHLKGAIPPAYLCVPLIAQGVAVGVLHLRTSGDEPPFDPNQQRLASRIAEYTALALTNLNLRDKLRSQAIRDPLTGLFNRRYMEETLEREIRRANRHNTSVGVILFDIDRMKPINDGFGHDAGDVLLRALGELMLRTFRGEDVACRYGGDEFTIVLPEASLADVWRRAEQFREAVKKLEVVYEGKSLGPVTLSIGVAAYPDHGLTSERVLLAADAASYASKSEGGDRIMVGRDGENA